MARRRKLSKSQAKAFLATQKGQEWLERKIAEKHAARPDPGSAPERFRRTKFPFEATINGRTVIVSVSAYGIEITEPERESDGNQQEGLHQSP